MVVTAFEVDGVDELQAQLGNFAAELRTKTAVRAVTHATNLLVPMLRATAPQGESGEFRRSITAAVRVYGNGVIIFGIVGPELPAGAHAARIEADSSFVLTTYESQRGQVLSVLSMELNAGIQEATT